MAAVPYIGPGSGLTHEHLNALYTEANARLKKVYGGLCPALWAGSLTRTFAGYAVTIPNRLFARKFFFFDSIPTAPYTTIAESLIGQLASLAAGGGGPPGYASADAAWFRKYDHTVFTNFVTAAAISMDGGSQAVDVGYPCVRLDPPASASTQQALIWPDRSPSPYPDGLLTWSLEAHKKTVTVSGVNHDCYCYVNDLGAGPSACNDSEAQHIDMDHPIDVFLGRGVGAAFTWPANFNKYGFIRFNNLQTVDVVLTTFTIDGDPDPGFSPTVPALGSLCIRRAPGINGWALGLDYFFLYFDGDPWFLKSTGETWSNTSNGLLAAVMLPHLGDDWTSCGGSVLDAEQWWDYGASGNAYWIGDPTNDATLLGDLCIHAGKLLRVDYSAGPPQVTTKTWIEFAGMAELSAQLAAAGIVLTNNSSHSLFSKGFELNATGPTFELIDYSTNLLHAGGIGVSDGSGETGVLSMGSAIAAFVWDSLQIQNRLACCEIVVIDQTATWANTVTWTNTVWRQAVGAGTDGSGNIYKGYFETLGSAKTDLLALRPSADVTTSITSKMTVHGPWLMVQEDFPALWPADNFSWWQLVNPSGFTELYYSVTRNLRAQLILNGDGSMTRKSSGPLFELHESTRPKWAIYGAMDDLGDYVPEFAAPLWPRIDRPWTSLRYFKRPDGEPLGTNGAGSLQVPPPPDSALPFEKIYLEAKPFVDWHHAESRLDPFSGSASPAPGVFKKKDIRILAHFNPVPDFYGSLSAWINRGVMKFQTYDGTPNADYAFRVTDLSSDVAQENYYGIAQPSIQGATATNYDGGQDLLPMMAEHFNAAAGAVNGVVAVGAMGSYLGYGGVYISDFLNSFIPARTTLGLGSNQLRPRSEYASWSDGDAVGTAWAALGVTIRTKADFPADYLNLATTQHWYYVAAGSWSTSDTPPGGGAAITVGDNWMSFAVGTAADNYRWVSIGDVQAKCAALGVPFKMFEVCVPASIQLVDSGHTDISVPETGGDGSCPKNAVWYVCDVNGNWVFDPDVTDPTGNMYILRSNVSRSDVYVVPLGGPGVEAQMDFSPLDTRFYYSGLYGGQSPTWGSYCPTQFILGNSAYLCRNWGLPAANALIWPRNYADVQPRDPGVAAGARYTSSYAIVARTTLESAGLPVTVVACTADAETMITTSIENAYVQVWPGDLPLT